MTDQQHRRVGEDTGPQQLNPQPWQQPRPPGRWRVLSGWLRRTTTTAAATTTSAVGVPDSPAVLDRLGPPRHQEPPAAARRPSPAAEILRTVLAGTAPARRPTPKQQAALTATIAAALTDCGWSIPDLQATLARWDTDQMRQAYPLIRCKLAVLARRAGHYCPRCQRNTPLSRHYAYMGFCEHCRAYTGDG